MKQTALQHWLPYESSIHNPPADNLVEAQYHLLDASKRNYRRGSGYTQASAHGQFAAVKFGTNTYNTVDPCSVDS